MDLHNRNQKQREFFNEKIDTYDDSHASFMTTKNAITDSLSPTTRKVLDLGAGTGLELIRLFEVYPTVEVTVIDISENMLAELRKRDFSNRVTTICGDFFETDFGSGYDAVISTSALHHFTPEEKLVLYKKVRESLKVGGQFINCDKVSHTAEEQAEGLYELEYRINDFKHVDAPLLPETEIELLTQSGFSEISTETVEKENYRLIKAKKL